MCGNRGLQGFGQQNFQQIGPRPLLLTGNSHVQGMMMFVLLGIAILERAGLMNPSPRHVEDITGFEHHVQDRFDLVSCQIRLGKIFA